MANPFASAQEQLQAVVEHIAPQYEDSDRFTAAVEKLRTPMHVHETTLSITGTDGSTKEFPAYRSQHNNARGPFKGGIRFHTGVDKDEVRALSMWMTWKTALVGIPYGGGKGGIQVDVKSLDQSELQALAKAYAEFLSPHIGPWIDVPAPDVNTGEQTMAWMLDAYEKAIGHQAPATFTGKPLALGGSLGRTEATGQGGAFALQSYAQHHSLDPKQTKVAVQGIGNVGSWFATLAHQMGFVICALSDSSGAVVNDTGLDPAEVIRWKQEEGSLQAAAKKHNATFISNENLLELDVDILVPAALENAIHKDNAANISAKVVLELANGPTTPEAEKILTKNNVQVLPDIFCNAGGVTVSYFEWVQNLQGDRWKKARVNERLQELMEDAYDSLEKTKQEYNVTYREAGYILAVTRVIDAMMLRGEV